MVERPIKKSERQAKAAAGEGSDRPVPEASKESSPPLTPRSKDRSKGKDKKGARQEEPKQAVNPALLRGPKPMKAKPPVEEIEPEAETPSEEAQSELESESAPEALETAETSPEETPSES
jgi:hypothetical protein